MLRRRVVKAENHASRGYGSNRDIVEGLSVLCRNKMQHARLQFEFSAVQHGGKIVGDLAWILTIPCKSFSCRVLVDDPPVAIANNDDVFDAGKNGVVERQELHQLFIEEIDGVQFPPG